MKIEVVRVWIGDPTNGGKFNGTAFFINGDTLVTAKHVIERYIDRETIYINTLSDGSTMPIERENINLCPKRDIATLKIKREIIIDKINFSKKIKEGDVVTIKGFDGNLKAPVNHLPHTISGYEGEHYTFRLQNSIASGYSGSPVILDDKLCAIVYARGEDKNLTYIIPIDEVCSAFIKDELNKSIVEKKNTIYVNSISNKEDTSVMKEFSNRLSNLGHKVYFSPKDELVKSLIELKKCKYFILFLSEEAFRSEIVIEKIKEIKKLQKDSIFPAIIPIRFKIDAEYNINYDLSKLLLDDIEPFKWNNINDIDYIVRKVHEMIALSKTPKRNSKKIKLTKSDFPVPNAPLRFPNGYDSEFYIERKEDEICLRALELEERLIRIKAPKQFGKTSLIARLIQKEKKSHTIVNFNFSNLNRSIFINIETLLDYICDTISRKTKIYIDTVFEELVPNDRATEYIEEILNLSQKNIILIIDNADELFKYSEVSNDFFSLIRAWHEEPTMNDESPLKKLKIIISHSTEASLATANQNSSPFYNVGRGVELKPFLKNELDTLADKHSLVLNDNQLDELINYIGGHPYLSRLVFYSMKNENKILTTILNRDNELFNDHLLRYLWKLNKNEKYKNILIYIINGIRCKKNDSRECYILESIGLIKKEKFICKLYEEFFREHF